MDDTLCLPAVLDLLEDGACLLGADGRLRFVNAAALALLGRPASALLGRALRTRKSR